jgi:hypothetical protein
VPGGFFTQRGTIQIKGSTTIRRNTATSTSGGLELATGTQAVMQDTAAVTGNTVTTDTGYGGGVTINRGNAGVPGQPDQPGASLVLNDAASISDNTLTCSSSSNGGGGGVYVDGADAAGSIARLTLNGTSKIQGNSAPNSSGGGIRNLGSVTLSSGCLISGNTASSGLGGGGGGISSGGIFAPNATLTGNTDTNVTNNTPNNVVISS